MASKDPKQWAKKAEDWNVNPFVKIALVIAACFGAMMWSLCNMKDNPEGGEGGE